MGGARIWRGEDGQAVVELAVVAPVLLVLSLVVYNLMGFTSAVARFDRVAPDIVLAQAVSPTAGADALEAVRSELEQAMDGFDVELEVSVLGDGAEGGETLLSLIGGRQTYSCTLRYKPFPSSIGLAGVEVEVPTFLSHTREVVVDPWKSGVVV